MKPSPLLLANIRFFSPVDGRALVRVQEIIFHIPECLAILLANLITKKNVCLHVYHYITMQFIYCMNCNNISNDLLKKKKLKFVFAFNQWACRICNTSFACHYSYTCVYLYSYGSYYSSLFTPWIKV